MEQAFVDPSEELDQLDDNAPEVIDEPREPVMVNIRYAGSTYQVPEHLADAWQRREDEFQARLSRQGQELGQLRQQTQQPRPERQEPAEPTQDDDLEFFQSPSKAMEKRVRQAEERAYQRIQEETAQREARNKYWGKFYADNKDLADHEDVVQFLVQKHFEDLKDLSPAESQRELASKAKAFLGRPQGGKPLPDRQVTTERSSNPTPPARPKAEEAPKRKYTGLSAELAAKAERRRRAAYNIPKDND
jgi:hypothetical protein